jgi:hypothetical protein
MVYVNHVHGPLIVVPTTILDIDHLTFMLNEMELNNVFRNLYVLSCFNFMQESIIVSYFKNIWRICNVVVQIRKFYYILHIVSYHYYFLEIFYLFQHGMSLTYEDVLFN